MKARRRPLEYVVCVNNGGYRASLVVRRIYQVLPDNEAARRGLLRVIDESGEDYLHPKALFVGVELPRAVSRRFSIAT